MQGRPQMMAGHPMRPPMQQVTWLYAEDILEQI